MSTRKHVIQLAAKRSNNIITRKLEGRAPLTTRRWGYSILVRPKCLARLFVTCNRTHALSMSSALLSFLLSSLLPAAYYHITTTTSEPNYL